MKITALLICCTLFLSPAFMLTAGQGSTPFFLSPAAAEEIIQTEEPSHDASINEGLSLFVINVGKADSLLMQCGESAWLIDTGRSRTWETVEAALEQFQIAALDGVFITHMDSDHVGGLKKLLKSDITVDTVYVPAFYLPDDEEDENPAVSAAEKRKVPVVYLQGGDSLPLGGGTLKVLGPLHAAEDKEDSNSLVLLAETADGSMLLAGDMEFPEESDLLDAGVISEADVLKVANHGDGDATSEAFISLVRPSVAVISTSTEEKSSTPASRVMKLLKRWDVDTYVTQDAELGILVTLRNGEIVVEMR